MEPSFLPSRLKMKTSHGFRTYHKPINACPASPRPERDISLHARGVRAQEHPWPSIQSPLISPRASVSHCDAFVMDACSASNLRGGRTIQPPTYQHRSSYLGEPGDLTPETLGCYYPTVVTLSDLSPTCASLLRCLLSRLHIHPCVCLCDCPGFLLPLEL